jgi:hypothetical protein
LIEVRGGDMHVLCAMRTQPAATVAPQLRERARMCCLMAFADGDVDRAARVFDILRALVVEVRR